MDPTARVIHGRGDTSPSSAEPWLAAFGAGAELANGSYLAGLPGARTRGTIS